MSERSDSDNKRPCELLTRQTNKEKVMASHSSSACDGKNTGSKDYIKLVKFLDLVKKKSIKGSGEQKQKRNFPSHDYPCKII